MTTQSYTITFDGRDFQAAWNRLTYTFPACLCVSHPGECPWSADGHKPFKHDAPLPVAWTRDLVDALMSCVTSGKSMQYPRSKFGVAPAHTARNVVGPKAPKSDPTAETVAKLQALCDAAAARGGA